MITYNKKSWHYKAFSYTCRGLPPTSTTLCQYWRRIVFVCPPLSILFFSSLALVVMLLTVIYVLTFPFKLIAGKYPSLGFWGEYVNIFSKKEKRGDDKFWEYRSYESPVVICGKPVYPKHLLLFMGAAAVGWFLIIPAVNLLHLMFLGVTSEMFDWIPSYTLSAQTTLCLGILCGLLILGLVLERLYPEVARAPIELLKAWKEKACPIVQFVDDDKEQAS